jgi:hypothetical protein
LKYFQIWCFLISWFITCLITPVFGCSGVGVQAQVCSLGLLARPGLNFGLISWCSINCGAPIHGINARRTLWFKDTLCLAIQVFCSAT